MTPTTRGRRPSRATRPDRPDPGGHPDALAVGARVRLLLAYHAAAGTPGRPTDVGELAQAMGANIGSLRTVLAGHRGPPASWGRARGRVTLQRLAQALGCPVEALSATAPPHAVLPLRAAACVANADGGEWTQQRVMAATTHGRGCQCVWCFCVKANNLPECKCVACDPPFWIESVEVAVSPPRR
jgi:hypothetical protein